MNGVYGRAATGLQNTSWAVNENVAKIGAKGEQKTEVNGFAKKAAVLHDLRIPIPGFKANIDHAIVSGKSVLLIDSKMWRPGYRRPGGRHDITVGVSLTEFAGAVESCIRVTSWPPDSYQVEDSVSLSVAAAVERMRWNFPR